VLQISQSSFETRGSRWSLGQILSVLKWRHRTILAAIFVCLAGAAVYLVIAPNRYIATAVLLTETRQMPGADDASSSEATVDSTVVESQIEAVRSASLALHVIDKLGLADDPEFGNPKPTFVSRLMAMLPWRDKSGQADRREVALDNFLTKVKIERVGRSYVAEIDATSIDSSKAAKIANAVADGYIDDQLSARQESQERANKWMEDRLAELQEQAAKAEKDARASLVTGSNNSAPSSSASSPDDATVRDLTGKARIARASYEAYLNRYTQALQLQKIAIPTTGARVLTRAIPPNQPGSPRKILVLALSLIAGCTIGVLGAFGAEFLQPPVRSRGQLSSELGIRAFGPLPTLKVRTGLFGRDKELPLALIREAGRGANVAENELRKIKLAFNELDPQKTAQMIGVTSPRSHDGKTTVAYTLALLAAQAGSRTLLIDANAHNPTLARAFSEPNSELLTDFMNSADSSATVIRLTDHLSFLGQQRLQSHGHPADLFGCEAMQNALRRAQANFDYIIVDLPAGLDHMEPRAIAPLLDRILIVTCWGSPVADIERCLENADVLSNRVMGIVINKSPEARSRGSIRPIKMPEKLEANAGRVDA
jgi:succinoglycan biosynthesis transport protein ExoP